MMNGVAIIEGKGEVALLKDEVGSISQKDRIAGLGAGVGAEAEAAVLTTALDISMPEMEIPLEADVSEEKLTLSSFCILSFICFGRCGVS